MSNPRVLHVIPSVAPRYGGPSTAVWPMTSALREAGVDVELATTDRDGAGRLSADDLPDGRVPTHLFPSPSALSAWLRDHVSQYDLLHVHSLWNRVSAAACRAGRRAGIPYVIRPCGMLSAYTWARSPLKKRAYWRLIERRNVLGAAAIHATSEVERTDALACGVTAPVEAVTLGVERAAFELPERPGWLRERCGPDCGNKPIVLFLSRLHPKKGVADFLVPAFSRLGADAHLVIAGGVDDSTPNYGDEVAAAVARLSINGRVSILGPIVPADRWAAFDGAAVFCLPSRSENFGIVVAEAMARGCPVVATEGVDAADHVVAAGAGRRVGLDVDSIASGLREALSDRTGFGSRGRAYAGRHLSWGVTGAGISELYSRILAKSAGDAST